jgi:lysozyme
MQISQSGILLIQRFEGLRLQRYYDSVGVATIGFGTTEADLGYPVPATCTYAQAVAWLMTGMTKIYAAPINALISQGLKLNQNEYDALCSISYNEGPGIISDKNVYQMARDLAAHNLEAVGDDFMRYTIAGGQVLPGLVTRREAEQARFRTPVIPPKPPNPMLVFPTSIGESKFPNHGNERLTVEQTKGALVHPDKYKNYLQHTCYWNLKKFRDRIYRISLYEPPDYTKKRDKADWTTNSRGTRASEINDLMVKISKL